MTHDTPTRKREATGVVDLADTRPNLPLALGDLYLTRGAKELNLIEIIVAVNLHRSGCWGKTCEADQELNNQALADGDRIMSVHATSDGTEFWIITEWDRSYTTVLLPDEY